MPHASGSGQRAAGSVYGVSCGHRMIFSLQAPMINGGRTCSRSAVHQHNREPLLEE
ncbi:hypothetical protein [Streptomyces sp. NBC_01497]|uniref:hypothetical protein n=1 Tax=Streptomyces sp. NBC_01497 TaxID=2903885 RepID=UPI002E3661A3|nr:hypothetical protein [Streptomyces sp. NBC_01497]